VSTGGLGVYPPHTLFSCSCQVGPLAKGRLVPLGNSRGSVEAPISPSELQQICEEWLRSLFFQAAVA
jgi:hypothetical protein